MGAGRVLLGTLFCLVAAILVIFFVSLGYTVGDYPQLGSIELYQLIFVLIMHPYFCATLTLWSALAALAVGALIGGLVAKGVKAGIGVGILSWVINFVLYLALVYTFNFNAMIAAWNSYGIVNVVLDIIIGLGILVGAGAIGGSFTGGK